MRSKIVFAFVAIMLLLGITGCGKVECDGNHRVVKDPAVSATCKKTGLTEGSHCRDCGEIIVAQQTIPKAHDYEDSVVGSVFFSGEYVALECKKCGYRPQEKFSANLEIKIDEESGTCVILGKGKCKDRELNIPPVISGYPVVGIEKRAFSGERRITSVKIPDGVKSIGNYAFSECRSLANIEFPSGVTDMGTHVFYGCGSLESIALPEGLTTVKTAMFFSCASLENVVIPVSAKKIGMQTFASTALKRIFYGGTEEEWDQVVLDYGNGAVGSAEKYFYSDKEPQADGNYWRFVDGVPTIWNKE